MDFRRPGIEYIEESFAACGYPLRDIERVAAEARGAWGYVTGGSMPDAAEAAGARLHYRGLSDMGAAHGSVFIHGPNDLDVVLPDFTSPVRDQFTIAHELGHYVLHCVLGAERPIIAHRLPESRTETEWEANAFAAAFLMPEGEFRAAASRRADARYLASRFWVSRRAAEVRMRVLAVEPRS